MTCWRRDRPAGFSRSDAGSGTTPGRCLSRTPTRLSCLDAGLDGVVTHPKTLVSSDLGVADRRMGELRAADTDGRFFTSYTGFLASGNRPVTRTAGRTFRTRLWF